MQPLHVLVTLATSVAVSNPFGFIPLDEIVVEAALRRNLGGRETSRVLSPVSRHLITPMLSTEDSQEVERETLAQLSSTLKPARLSMAQRGLHQAVALTRIPLARVSAGLNWHWRASFGVCSSPPVRLGSGIYVLKASTMEWWCVGDEDKLAELLTAVKAIGVCRRQFGWVRDWQVRRSNRDWAIWRSGRLMRSVPHVDVPMDLQGHYWPARWGIRPPYRHPAHQAIVALPPMAGSSMADAPEQQSDTLQWRGLTLHRPTRTLVYSGRRHHLTPTEADLLATLIQAQGQPVWREILLQQSRPQFNMPVGKSAGADHPSKQSAERTLDVYIHRLRLILEHDAHHPGRLVTLRGWGYRLT